MKIVKPNWVKNENKGVPLSIFSIDIHPDGTRFVTGGQGNDCGRVTIWNFKAVISPEVENDENQPKLLCQIDSHLQCVNSVRWSHSGNYLASAGDDKLIMIWTLGGVYRGSTEQYKTVSTLRNHSGDILDLSWSHDDQFLASCSIDNSIVVWNALKWPEIIKILNGHCGLVKGVTWDPIGKYLASQSADKTLRIWRVSDWREEVCISEPFEQCGDTTHVLRVSWSPDGQYLVSAQAMNNCGSVAKIIDRQDWSYKKDFVGHRKAIPCSRFNCRIFKCAINKKKNGNEPDADSEAETNTNKETIFKPHCICALGSRDRSISIWSTGRSRPLAVIDDVFNNSVVDLSWSKSGYHLLACSVDGEIISFEFEESELGLLYSEDERVQCLQQLYGNSLFANKSLMANRLIEDMDILMMQNKINNSQKSAPETMNGTVNNENHSASIKKIHESSRALETSVETKSTIDSNSFKTTVNNQSEKESPNKSSPSSSNLSSPGRLAKGPTDKQIEIRSADGRRRIIPLFIPPTTAQTSEKNPTTSNASNSQQSMSSLIESRPITFSSSSESKSKIVVETLDESNPEQNLQAYQYLNNSHKISVNQKNTDLAETEELVSVSKKESEANKSLLSTKEHKDKNSIHSSTVTNGHNNHSQPIQSSEDSSNDEIVIKRKSMKRTKSNLADSQSNKRKPGRPPQLNTANDSNKMDSNTKIKTLHKPTIDSNVNHSQTAKQNQSVTSNSQIQLRSSTLISFPPLKSPKCTTNFKLFTSSKEGKIYSACVDYPLSSSGICKLSVFEENQLLWNIMLSNPIMGIVGSEEIVVCYCDDNTIHVFNLSEGKRLFLPILLEIQIARMIAANRIYLLLITCSAKLWLWDFSVPKVLIRGASLVPLLTDPKTSEQLSIQNASVSSTSKAIVTVSSGRTYIYDDDFQSWCLLNDLHDPLNSCTDLRPCAINSIKHLSSFTKFPSRFLINFFASNPQLTRQSVISFIEKQIEVSRLLGSANEYRFWILSLVQHLVSIHTAGSTNIENRLRTVCTNLLGNRFPLSKSRRFSRSHSNSLKNDFENLDKHELLREVLSILTSNLGLQRLYSEFKDLLHSYNDDYDYNNINNPYLITSNLNQSIQSKQNEDLHNDNPRNSIEEIEMKIE
ncbi:NADH dehydrogenase complex I [Sarcoptes scabiei]|nr:NADH dehydrogenase complex I [Sarcoptes scabiei]